jgi:hypothetical protein
VQALMYVYVAIKTEVLLAFWTADMQIRLASCKCIKGFVNEPDDYNTRYRNIRVKTSIRLP